MRKHFSNYIEEYAVRNEDVVFITGDLGYNALENLMEKMGPRFINAGVAEQNMVGMAAGLASQGFQVICYSIAPFVVYRCLEQVRNDVCFHNLPVYIAGNGGGYGYGIMGSSHHAIEDIGTLSGLPNMQCYVPTFVEDMNDGLRDMFARRRPAYFRLGLGKPMPSFLSLTDFGAMSAPATDAAITIVGQGPVFNNLLSNWDADGRADIFIVNKMPLTVLPAEIKSSISRTGQVLVIEEHIAIGGLGSALSLLINESGLPLKKFRGLHAAGYPNGLYGSQGYHQQQSGLDEANILRTINTYF